jgi:hypothetical protein
MPQADEPHPEPEIIPPDHAGPDKRRTGVFVDARGTERVYIARLHPLGFILVVLIVAILSAVMIALLLGTLLIWLPLLVFFVAGVIIVAVLRAYFTRAR